MVGGRQVLLSIAVLTSLGLDTVLGDRLRRQNGVVFAIQNATASSSSLSPSIQTAVTESRPEPTAEVTTTAELVSEDLTGSISRLEGTRPGMGPAAVSSGLVLLTSTEKDYTYPGVFGSGGTLTTDSNAPTRTAVPTRISVTSPPGGPPPAETTRTRTPPTRPPPRPEPAIPIPDDGEDTGRQSEESAAMTSAAATPTAATPTGPRGPPPGNPPRPATTDIVGIQTESVNLGHTPSNGTTFATSTRWSNETLIHGPSATVSYCQASDLAITPTTWSVVYTSTITWYGNPDDYTPAFPPLELPKPTSSCVIAPSPPRMTISVCTSTGTDSKYVTCDVTTTTASYGFGIQTTTPVAITFLTTDKNPAVVFTSPFSTPNYGVSQGEATTRDHHAKPTQPGAITPPPYSSLDPAQGMSSQAPVTVAVQPTAVVINGNTIRDSPTVRTQVVVISSQTFTINPSQVIGAGTTIDRAAATAGIPAPTPTTTNLANLPVVVSSSIAVIGGSTFTLPPAPTTVTVSGQTFTIGPSTIAVNTQTLALPSPPVPTEVVVAGGEVITAIGPSVVVIRGTTLTYQATASPPMLVTVDDDVLTLGGPGGGGVTAHDGALTLGGPGASPGETQYGVVGGATLTKIGASVVVIDGVSYTLGGATATATVTGTGTGTGAGGGGGGGRGVVVTTAITTVVGGETITIAPDGVLVGSTMTLAYPFGPTMVITPPPGSGNGQGGAAASATGGGGGGGDGLRLNGEEDAAAGLRPPARGWVVGGVAVVVAVGVGALGGF